MSLMITATASGGDSINQTAERMQALADQIATGIEVKFNDVTLWAWPGGSARNLIEGYWCVRTMKVGFKFASSLRPIAPASCDRSGEAGETGNTVSTEGESAVGSEADETPKTSQSINPEPPQQ